MKSILHEPQPPASSPTKGTGASPTKAPLEKAPIKLDDLPEDLLLDVGSHLDAQSWLALRQTSKTGGLQDALQSASVVRAVMQAQQTPPPIIDTLLSAPGDTAAARAHLTAHAQLRARLAKSPLTIALRVPTNSVPRVSVHPDGLGVVHWCTQRFPLHQWGRVNALAYYDLSQRAAGKPQAITLRPLVPRDVFPTDVAFAPDGKALYVALANGDVLRLQRAPTGTFAQPEMLHQATTDHLEEGRLLVSPGGKYLVLCRRTSGSVDVIDAKEGTLRYSGQPLRQRRGNHAQEKMATFLAEDELLLLDQERRLTYLTLHDTRPAEVRVEEPEMPLRTSLHLMHHERGGSWLERRVEADDGSATITVLDPSSLQLRSTASQGPAEKTILLDGGRIEVKWTQVEGRGVVSVHDARSERPAQMQFTLPGYDRLEGVASLSPDERKLAFVRAGPGRVGLVDLDAASPTCASVAGLAGFNGPLPTSVFSADSSLLLTLDGNRLLVRLA